MDFFGHQDRARRQTGLLMAYFAGAVVLIVLAVYGTVWALLTRSPLERVALEAAETHPFWIPSLLAWVAGVTLGVIALGALYKFAQLRGGGAAVAEMLGGTPVRTDTTEFRERQLLNVVGEMAIAAGVPAPPVYLLRDEDGINAFAAGFTPANAVIGVTQGCLNRLSRDELQGVIAHEFSHILNSDMRLNLRLIGVLHGILLIALVGQGILRGMLRSGARRRSSRGGKGGGGQLAVVLFGLALMAIGYIGVFFARLIQSAVSRQREYLADASAVQFTRNPDGLAGALKKIGGLTRGARVSAPNASTASHLFFGNALGSSWLGWMATHPPLVERVRRIDPAFDGRFAPVAAGAASLAEAYPGVVPGRSPAQVSRGTTAARAKSRSVPPLAPAALVSQVGTPNADHLQFAAQMRAALPAAVTAALTEPAGAQAIVYGLLLDPAPATREKQMAAVARVLPDSARQQVEALRGAVAGLPAEFRAPTLDLAMPALRSLSPAQLGQFQDTVRALAQADNEISLFEYTLQSVLLHYVEGWLQPNRADRVEFYTLMPVATDCRVVLSALAHLGADDASVGRAYNQAAAPLGTVGAQGLLPVEQCSLAEVDQALARLARLAPALKRRVLTACTQAVLADRQVAVEEAELLRAIAARLNCPMPPLLASAAATATATPAPLPASA